MQNKNGNNINKYKYLILIISNILVKILSSKLIFSWRIYYNEFDCLIIQIIKIIIFILKICIYSLFMNKAKTSFKDKYQKIKKMGEGTYGTVYKAKNNITSQIVAIKKIKFI
jgi:flagellar basal body-associated protein FliL